MENRESNNGHVYYFEPNDLDYGLDQYGEKVNLGPHLEDLCIAMRLTAIVSPRNKKDDKNFKTISWISYRDDSDKTVVNDIINDGVKMGDEKYLTTYYTEISADKYIENELIEGLGVTNVTIAFESWYTPTITINFIDVHGSALWGREEAIHDNGNITSENLLGVFFTQPYPLFQLQVKGFLGSAVTYQLSVSSFKGRYNSETGNFEATATFIGYSYSLLADIPLKLLSFAPELDYVGKSYWDEHVDDPEWGMICGDAEQGRRPVKLPQLIKDIKNAVRTLDSDAVQTCEKIEIGQDETSGYGNGQDTTDDGATVPRELAQQADAANYNLGSIEAVQQANAQSNIEDSTTTTRIKIGNNSDADSEDLRNKKIWEIIGFEPTIGNFVKMVMCHLETFVKIMMECGAEVTKCNRKSISLGIKDLKNTDIPNHNKNAQDTNNTTNDENDIDIWPWPALYNKNHKTDEQTRIKNDTQFEVLGWPGDYVEDDENKAQNWPELQVVNGFMKAIQKDNDETKLTSSSNETYEFLPMSGGDLIMNESPFYNVVDNCDGIYKIAPYLGLRIANLIGIGHKNCDDNMAKIIGKVDAINFIISSSNYEKLKKGVTPTGENQKFEDEVIQYLTCEKFSTESDGGIKYNDFEFMGEKTNIFAKGKKYHPMYVKDNNNYKYSYIYANNNDPRISIVPTKLISFRHGENVYKDIVSLSDNGDTYFTPNISTSEDSNTDVSQNFIYSCNTKTITDLYETTQPSYSNYTNKDIFYIQQNKNKVTNLLDEIESFKEGNITYNDYSFENDKDDIVKFLDTRYRVSKKTYFGRFNINKPFSFSRKISEYDEKYFTNHLCVSKEKINNVTYNNEIFSYDNELVNKGKIIIDENGAIKYKNDDNKDEDCTINDVTLTTLYIKYNDTTNGSLFGSELYYMQNQNQDKNAINQAKAYLILSSLMNTISNKTDGDYDVKIFTDYTYSLIEYIQPLYIYFCGALLWRKQYYDNNNVDPIQHSDIMSKNFADCNTTLLDIDWNVHIHNTISIDYVENSKFYGDYDKMDVAVRNKLIFMFNNFVESDDFITIINNCELKTSDNEDNSWEKISSKWNSINSKENPSEWVNIFGENFINQYSSVNVTNDGYLQLLFNEQTNGAVEIFKKICGIESGFIVGRSTSGPVGTINDGQISISSVQMNGYLSGFKEMIDNFVEEVKGKKAVKKAKDINERQRDIAISMYYSLKHIWDSWLITEKEDHFTVKNFFKKYFVFIDSFYVNIYDILKINAQHILDNYETENINLLTFITNVASKVGCMFFSMPTFLDSNIQGEKATNIKNKDLKFNVDNIKNMFTPTTYNSMGNPNSNNVFVFIYTHPFSDNAMENTDHRFDSYDIWNINTRPKILNIMSKNPSQEELATNSQYQELRDVDRLHLNEEVYNRDDIVSRYAYDMPAFGVAVNRGNNYIFKSINVNMVSPKITAISAQTWEDILTKTGADGERRVFFHGQDIYSIYSQYAYACEIEMLGCAQIQPLMYFQLLNIPMWRGTYMIYKVSHTIQPGNMMTKFVGMKMSRRQAPFAQKYSTVGAHAIEKAKEAFSDSNSSGLSNSGQYPVGGEEMIKNIFGTYTQYKISHNYDEYRGKTLKSGKDHWHCGIDISGAEGTPLYAPWDGYVKYVRLNSTSAGNYLIFIDNTKTVGVVFMHCKEIKVTQDSNVKFGEVLALLGKTGGNACRNGSIHPHLHLELHKNDKDFVIGEEKRHPNGIASHVDPSINIGYLNNKSFLQEGESDLTKKTDKFYQGTNSKVSNNFTVIGSSWAAGVARNFKNYICKEGKHVIDYKNTYMRLAVKYNTNKIIAMAAMNDGGGEIITKMYKQMANLAHDNNKILYALELPTNIGIGVNVDAINKRINDAQTEANKKFYRIIPKSIFDNLNLRVGSDKLHFTETQYNILAKAIINYMSNH